MSKQTNGGLGINIVLDSSQNIKILQNCLSLYFDMCNQQGVHTVYEIVVNDYIEYFIYEIWIVEQPRSIKRFVKELTISLSEFRENFYVNVNATHEIIAEKYSKEMYASMVHSKTIPDK